MIQDSNNASIAGDVEFINGLIKYMRPKYEILADLLDSRPHKWLDTILKIRSLCEKRGIFGESQYPYVVANLFAK